MLKLLLYTRLTCWVGSCFCWMHNVVLLNNYWEWDNEACFLVFLALSDNFVRMSNTDFKRAKWKFEMSESETHDTIFWAVVYKRNYKCDVQPVFNSDEPIRSSHQHQQTCVFLVYCTYVDNDKSKLHHVCFLLEFTNLYLSFHAMICTKALDYIIFVLQ